jgi:hypothetical protein
MPPIPVQVTFNQAHADSAKAIHDCAVRLHENPLPNTDACRITQFAGAWQPPPQCNISFFWTQATGGPPNFTVQCQQPADFFFVYGGNVPPASHFLGNNVLYSDLAENYNVFILACASQSATNPGPGEASCATFSIDKGPPDWCPAPHGPFVRFPQCCRACVDAGGFCHHDTRTGGCICE